jgi:hypothetical protein
LWDIVTRVGVKLDGGDRLFAELHLGVNDLTHRISSERRLCQSGGITTLFSLTGKPAAYAFHYKSMP